MKLTPYECIHCKGQTKNCAIVHFVYDQYVYERNMYSNYHNLKDIKQVDAGLVPVFVCDQCIKSMKLFAKHYKARIVFSFLVALFSFFSLRTAPECWYFCIIPFIGACGLMIYSNGEAKERVKHQTRNMVDKGVGQMLVNTSGLGSKSEWTMVAVMLVVYIAGIIAKGKLFNGLVIIMLVASAGACLWNIFRLVTANAKPDESDIKEAALHYIYFDEDILIKDRG